LPEYVSFTNLEFKEGETTATMTGWFVGRVNGLHAAWDHWYDVSDGDITWGCKVLLPEGDKAEAGPIWDPEPYSDGTFHWDIPWLYKAGGTEEQFDYAPTEFTVDPAGNATVEKYGVGPYSNNHSDETEDYCP
jgi:hypothetical protein